MNKEFPLRDMHCLMKLGPGAQSAWCLRCGRPWVWTITIRDVKIYTRIHESTIMIFSFMRALKKRKGEKTQQKSLTNNESSSSNKVDNADIRQRSQR